MDLDAYRRQAERFLAQIGAAYYDHYAGLSDAFAVDAIYAENSALFSFDAVAQLQELSALAGERARAGGGASGRDGASGAGAARGRAGAPSAGDEARRLRMLLDFAVEGCIGLATARETEQLALRESGLRLDAGGQALGFRESTVVQSNEPDRARRAEIEAARLDATARELTPLHRAVLDRSHQLARELGWESYRAMCAELKGVDLARLASAADGFLRATDGAYASVMDGPLRATVGVGLDELQRADLPWFFRAAEQDGVFPADRLLGALDATLAGLGLGATAGGRVLVDVEPRPRKSPRAFCVSVRTPQDVRLVVAPVGGRDDYVALLHESGHAQHFAHVDPALAFEYRHLGDNAVTEAFAFLFDRLTEDPLWLRERLGVEDPDGALAAHARASRLLYLRRYCAKLAYELVAHGRDEDADGATAAPSGSALAARAAGPTAPLADLYARELSRATGVTWPRETYLADMDEGFYVAAYLRAWALETHLRQWLLERFGERWFSVPAAGAALRELWGDGQRLSAEELLRELTGEQLDVGVLVADLGLSR